MDSMTYLDLINRFWARNRIDPLKPNDICLYFFILDEYNKREWPNAIELPNGRIIFETGLSERALVDARNRLQQKGFISFESGNRRSKSPVYCLQYEGKNVGKTAGKSVGKTEGKTVGKTAGKTEGKNSSRDNNVRGDSINKTKTKDKEDTPNGASKKDAAHAATLSRKKQFYESLVPYVEKYGKEMIREFYDYWSEMNRSETAMRFEQQPTWETKRRLSTWANREKNFKSNGTTNRTTDQEDLMRNIAEGIARANTMQDWESDGFGDPQG